MAIMRPAGLPTFGTFTPLPAQGAASAPAFGHSQSASAPKASPSADLLKVYFGAADVDRFDIRPGQKAPIRQAVAWYNQNVMPIPPIVRGDNRKNHGVHLRMIGEVVGLLPRQSSAQDAYWLYMDTFNGFERSVAPGKKDMRMYCHDREKKTAKPGQYLTRQYGFHILVFAPNGAIEAFRRKVPSAANMNGRPGENIGTRMQWFDKTEEDYDKLLVLIEKKQGEQVGPPKVLGTSKYVRRILNPGTDGNDAWKQPAVLAPETVANRAAFEATQGEDAA